jgi:hypothetical protein
VRPGLEACLERIGAAEPALAGAIARLPACDGPCEAVETLRPRRVHRLSFPKGSLVIKRLPFDRSHREQRALRHWLPHLGLGELAVPLLDVVPAAKQERVWHVYEDLGDRTLEQARAGEDGPAATRAVLSLVSTLHVRFAAHPLLADGRLAGPELGGGFFASAVTDAVRCLAALRGRVGPDGRPVVERLLERLTALAAETGTRRDAFEALDWPETLLHGDLWLGNCVVTEAGGAHLIDWERTGVGPAIYDLSTFLRQLPEDDRAGVLTRYRQAVARAGWTWPGPERLERAAETCELARFASCLVWRVLPCLEAGEVPAWLLDDLVETERWFAERTPLLAADRDRSAA